MAGRPPAPWTKKIVEIITPPEGQPPEWVSLTYLVSEVSDLIPSDKIVSTMIHREYTSPNSAIRDIVSSALSNLKKSKKIDVEYVENPRRVVDKVRITQKGIRNRAALRFDSHPWTVRILEILDDGEWHNYDTVLLAASPLVPPGMAWRQAEARRQLSYTQLGRKVEERSRGDRNDTIKTGQRHFVSVAIRSLRANNRIEVEYGDQEIRKRPVRLRLK